MEKSIKILWLQPAPAGTVGLHGQAAQEWSIAAGTREVVLSFKDVKLLPGSRSALVHVRTIENPFSFYLRDVTVENPIYIEPYHVIVTTADDARSADEIVRAIQAGHRQTAIERYEAEEEENFQAAAARSRNLRCETWLGIARDVRIFQVGFHTTSHPDQVWDSIVPQFHSKGVPLPELGGKEVRYHYFAGRGVGSSHHLTRRLDEDCLPIVHACFEDGSIHYHSTLFATLERSRLTADQVRGTHYLVSDEFSVAATQTEAQRLEKERLLKEFEAQDEETALYLRIEAVNTASSPCYAWMRAPQPNEHALPELTETSVRFDPATGFGTFESGRVFLIASLNGRPLPDVETAVLLAPGECAEYVFIIPHCPVSQARAAALAKQCFEERYQECRAYWRKKLESMAKITLPEKRIENMCRAAALHMDLIAFGQEPDGPIAPCVGVYSPIGTESTPIIQFFESIGWTDEARRAIEFFLAKQHEDGFMQNFQSYMSETGCALFNAAMHYRYTGDAAYLTSISGKLKKSCDYLIDWAKRNEREALRGRGYGMIDGKVADPEDAFHSYMLNATTYGGLYLCGKTLQSIGDADAPRILAAADELRKNILDALAVSVAEAPVAPLADGRWVPAISPWPENVGAVALFADGGNYFSHGTAMGRDGLLGPLSLVLYGVLPPDHTYADFMMDFACEHLYLDNVCYSQPYYSVHPFLHIQRKEVRSFLKEFYNAVAGLADRETYTFYEHYYLVSPHKTHEEGWFMMRVRSMLYMERGKELHLLPGVPRAWMNDGLSFTGMRSRLGEISLDVQPAFDENRVRVRIEHDGAASRLVLRVPHPEGRRALCASGGVLLEDGETILVENPHGETWIELTY